MHPTPHADAIPGRPGDHGFFVQKDLGPADQPVDGRVVGGYAWSSAHVENVRRHNPVARGSGSGSLSSSSRTQPLCTQRPTPIRYQVAPGHKRLFIDQHLRCCTAIGPTTE